MLEELLLAVEDRPGILAEIGDVLGQSRINIESICASTYAGQGVVHLVVEDADGAAQALTEAGFPPTAARPVLSVTLEDRPGELGRYCRRLSAAGVNISAAYVTRRSAGETELIFAVDDLTKAERA